MFCHVFLDDGMSFNQTWFLQVLEVLADVLLGFVLVSLAGTTMGITNIMFEVSTMAQILAKTCKFL